jgi:hypothetical protein
VQQITLQYPAWYILFCVLAGIAAAVFLYRKDKTFTDLTPLLRNGMAILRGLTVALLCFLLLAPLLKLLQSRSEHPIVIFAQDQSLSVRAAISKIDSSAYVTALADLRSRLEDKYEVHSLGFGQEVLPTDQWMFDDQASDLGELMHYMDEQYGGQNVGAVIIASDGAINRGRNPLYVAPDFKAPISVIALGDTIRKTDLQVKEVFHNSIAYMGDKFSVQVDLAAIRLDGAETFLEVKHIQDNQQVLIERTPLKVNGDPWFETKSFTIEAKQSGVQRYRVQVGQVRNEENYVNNTRDFFVEVIDGRLKVLLLANSPHPDIAVWKSALLAQRNYEVDVKMAAECTPQQLKGYDLVVLHQLPSSKYLIGDLLGEIQKLSMPKIFVVGFQTDLYALNNSQSLLRIESAGDRSPNEVTMMYNPGFTSFKTTPELQKQLQTFSPLLSPFGEYLASPSAQVLAWQRIGQVETDFPLIVMGEANDTRTCVIAGEGMWKWQLFDQLQNGSKEITHELLTQLAQYASTKSDKRKFKVTSAKKLYSELEEISFQAELYNDNYELVNSPEVRMIVRNQEKQEFNYTFNISGDAYALKIGRFPEGTYTYIASTELNGVKHTHEGKFVVQPVQLESLSLTADHGLLRQLAQQHQGQLVYPADMASLADQVLGNESLKPVLYSTTQTRPLIHLKWICILLLTILSVEWFLRRYYGGY